LRFSLFHRERVKNLILAGPLVEAGDQSEQTLQSKRTAETMTMFNPFFGQAILQSTRESAAEQTATSIVDGYLARSKLPRKLKRAPVIAAVKAQIRSVESFDLVREVNADWPSTTLLLAGNESPTRMRLQMQVSQALESAHVPVQVAVVKDASHGILADKPRESVDVVLKAMRDQVP
jgi:pimeloyl-ACP methyl ester carboxylesterase